MEMVERPWDALPSLALVNIFRRISIRDRTRHVPLVCSSWAHASRDPHCWTSMVPDSAVDYAFVKDSKPYAEVSVDVYGGRSTDNHRLGLSRLQTLIQRADGGGGITSLFLFPFLSALTRSPNDDSLLRLIAQSCPNLKYFSLYGTYFATKEAILEVIRSCNKLELVDFADSPYFSPLVLEEMGKCCPNIRGIRRNGSIEQSAIFVLATSFRGRLKLLNLSDSPILEEDLLTVVSGCLGLQYLDIRGCRKFKSDLSIIQRASAQIVEFFYDRDLGGRWGGVYYDSQGDGSGDSSVDWDDDDDDDDDDDVVSGNSVIDYHDDIVDEDEDVMDDVVTDDDDHIVGEDEDENENENENEDVTVDVPDYDDQIADEDEVDVSDYDDQIAYEDEEDEESVVAEEEEEEEEEEEAEAEAEDNDDDHINGSEDSCHDDYDDDDVSYDGYSDSFDDYSSFDNDDGDDSDYY